MEEWVQFRGDQKAVQECYHYNLQMRREPFAPGATPRQKIYDTNVLSWDLTLRTKNERRTPIEDLKEVQIRPLDHQVTKLSTSLKMHVPRICFPYSTSIV